MLCIGKTPESFVVASQNTIATSGDLWHANLYDSASATHKITRWQAALSRRQSSMIPQDIDKFLAKLKARFEAHTHWHEGVAWPDVLARIEAGDNALMVLMAMEASGGEPDLIGVDAETGRYIFCDCSAESPLARRSLCYDHHGRESRKNDTVDDSALEMAHAIGIDLLTEQEYLALQKLGEFDLKSSSWLKTPPELRRLGGALFGDRRYGRAFVYHNGAQSYYAARGFRGIVKV